MLERWPWTAGIFFTQLSAEPYECTIIMIEVKQFNDTIKALVLHILGENVV